MCTTGNGTEAILRGNLYLHEVCEALPTTLPFAHAAVSMMSYKPWLDDSDGDNVLSTSARPTTCACQEPLNKVKLRSQMTVVVALIEK